MRNFLLGLTLGLCLGAFAYWALRGEAPSGVSHGRSREPATREVEATDRSGPGFADATPLDLGITLNELMASARGKLTVVVIDADAGAPIGAGVFVAISGSHRGVTHAYEATTSIAGEAVFEDVVYPLAYRVSVRSREEGLDQSESFVMARTPQKARIEVDRRTIVSGLVQSTAGSPIAGARVSLVGSTTGEDGEVSESNRACVTGDDGRFSVGLDGTRDQVDAMVWADGHLPTAGEIVERGRHQVSFVFTVVPSATVFGRVLQPDGSPLAKGEIHILTIRRTADHMLLDARMLARLGGTFTQWTPPGESLVESVISFRLRTDESGSFVATPVVPAEECWLVVYGNDVPPIVRKIDGSDLPVGRALDLKELRFERRTRPPRVTVFLPDGTPAARVDVTFQLPDVPSNLQVNSPTYRTDASGEFDAPFLSIGGTYTAFVRGRSVPIHENVEGLLVGESTVLRLAKALDGR